MRIWKIELRTRKWNWIGSRDFYRLVMHGWARVHGFECQWGNGLEWSIGSNYMCRGWCVVNWNQTLLDSNRVRSWKVNFCKIMLSSRVMSGRETWAYGFQSNYWPLELLFNLFNESDQRWASNFSLYSKSFAFSTS